jgi:hypothetical protein
MSFEFYGFTVFMALDAFGTLAGEQVASWAFSSNGREISQRMALAGWKLGN